jgi:hypothetical protein
VKIVVIAWPQGIPFSKKEAGKKNKQEAEIVSKSYYLDPWYLNLFFCKRGIVIFLPYNKPNRGVEV